MNAGLKNFQNGDFTKTIEIDTSYQLKDLINGVNTLGESLKHTIEENKMQSENIQKNSNAISNSVKTIKDEPLKELNNIVQETTSSMQDIGATQHELSKILSN